MQNIPKTCIHKQKHLGGDPPHANHITGYLQPNFTLFKLLVYIVFTWALQPVKQNPKALPIHAFSSLSVSTQVT